MDAQETVNAETGVDKPKRGRRPGGGRKKVLPETGTGMMPAVPKALKKQAVPVAEALDILLEVVECLKIILAREKSAL